MLSWPLRKGTVSVLQETSDEETIKASVMLILSTAFGERSMRPTYGSTLWQSLFEPVDAVLVGSIRRGVVDAIRLNEPRVRMTDVTVVPEENSVTIYVQYMWQKKRGQVGMKLARSGVE